MIRSIARIGKLAGRLALMVAALSLTLATAQADTFRYAAQRRQIRAGILTSNTAFLENYAPYVFYVMEKRADVKPAGYEFINPLAPSNLTPQMLQRIQERIARSGGTDPSANSDQIRVNAPLTKNIGVYWEVNLDTVSTDDLQQFDILLMTTRGSVRVSPSQSAKLRRFTDGGGTLVVDDQGGTNFNSAGFLISVGFNSSRTGTVVPTLLTQHHPLVSFPYRLTNTDIFSLGPNGAGGYSHFDPAQTNSPPAPNVVVPVVLSGTGLPYVSAGDFGGGHLVISSAGIATGVSGFVGGVALRGYGPNNGAISGEDMQGARPTDLKFAHNIVSWTGAAPTASQSVRRSQSTAEQIGTGVGRKFANVPIAPNNPGSGATIWKGVVFFVDGNNVLHAYDANPTGDLDGDGNPDDGLTDFLLSTPYDEIWRVSLGGSGRFSTPSVYSVNTTNGPIDIVATTSSAGVTAAYIALERNTSAGRFVFPPALAWTARAQTNSDLNLAGVAGGLVPAPALSEGVLFTLVQDSTNAPDAERIWRIAALNPRTGQSIFDGSAFNGSNPTVAPTVENAGATAPGLPRAHGPLAVGYVRDSRTGALDKVVYTAGQAIQSGQRQAGSVNGVWFGTRNEPLLAANPPSNTKFRALNNRGLIPWFVTGQDGGNTALNPLVYRVTYSDIGGARTVSNVEEWRYNTDFRVTWNGEPGIRGTVVELLGGKTVDPLTQELYADYTVNWPLHRLDNGQSPSGQNDIDRFANGRGRFLAFAVNLNGSDLPQVTGAPALSREDVLVFNTRRQTNTNGLSLPDRIYGFREQFPIGTDASVPGTEGGNVQAGGGAQQVRVVRRIRSEVGWMWSPIEGASSNALGATPVPPRLIATERSWLPSGTTGVPITNFRAVGSPAVANGVAYVVGIARLGTQGNALATVILALRANPQMTFQADRQIQPGLPVALKQINTSNPSSLNDPYITLQENVNFTIDRESGTITIHDFRTESGESFNTALPIYVQAGTENPGTIVANRSGYGPLDNLLWYMVIPRDMNYMATYPGNSAPSSGLYNILPASGATVVGNTLYFGTGDVLGAASGNTPANAQARQGRIVAVQIPNLSGGAQAPIFGNRPIAGGSVPDPNQPNFSVRDALTVQTGAGINLAVEQPIIHPPAAAAGMLAVGTPAGLAGFENLVTVITDASRIVEVDYQGNAVWTMDATRSFRVAGGELPFYEGGADPINANAATGRLAAQAISLARPNTARRLAQNAYLIADTGNNRIVETDKSGIVTREIHGLNNDLGFLRAGDPLTLNAPTDVQTFLDDRLNQQGGSLSLTNAATGVTFTYAGRYFARHYIIADSGNFRAVEVVTIIDENGNPIRLARSDGQPGPLMVNQVIFTTRSLSEQNARLRYRTIQQFIDARVNRAFLIAAIDNARPAAVDPGAQAVGAAAGGNVGAGGGSLLFLRRYPQAGDTFRDGDVQAVVSSVLIPVGQGQFRRQFINNPTWFKAFTIANASGEAELHYLLADVNGVYEIQPNTQPITTPEGAAAPAGAEAQVLWMLSSQDYQFLTGRPLRAASLQRLPQSDYDAATNRFYPRYLVTNRYSGPDYIKTAFAIPDLTPGEIRGEVFEVRGVDFYQSGGYRNPLKRLYETLPFQGGRVWFRINSLSAISWMAPRESIPQIPQQAGLPGGAILRRIGAPDSALFTGIFDQPTFSDRPY